MNHRDQAITRQRDPERLDASGSAIVEFALTVPFLILLVMGIADFGMFLNNSQSLAAATRIGAEYGWNNPTCKSGINVLATPQISTNCTNGITAAITGSTLVDTATVTVATPTLTCKCDDGTAIACGNSSCATLAPPHPGPKRLFITVSASQPFTPLFSWSGGPGLPGLALLPNRLSGLTELRLQ